MEHDYLKIATFFVRSIDNIIIKEEFSRMNISILKETTPGEKRVLLTPVEVC